MNDEDLGRALTAALTPPAVRAAPDAGPRLRARVRRQRGRHAVLGTVAAGLAVLLAVGLVRWVSTAPPPVATPRSDGPARLSRPLEFLTTVPVPALPCPSPGVLVCTPPASFLVVDEVRDLRVVGEPDGTATVRVTLPPVEADVLAAVAGWPSPEPLRVRAGGRDLPVPPDALRTLREAGAYLPLAVSGVPAGAALVAALGPQPLPEPRPGPGPLRTPLEIWAVEDGGQPTPGPCWLTPAPGAPGVRVLDTSEGCMVIRGPGVRLDRLDDLRILPAEPVDRVEITLAPADRAKLRAFTAAHVLDRVVFLVGGRPVGSMPELQGVISGQLEIVVADRPAAESLVARLRTWPPTTPVPGGS